ARRPPLPPRRSSDLVTDADIVVDGLEAPRLDVQLGRRGSDRERHVIDHAAKRPVHPQYALGHQAGDVSLGPWSSPVRATSLRGQPSRSMPPRWPTRSTTLAATPCAASAATSPICSRHSRPSSETGPAGTWLR